MKILSRVQLGGILILAVLCGSCMKQVATEKVKESALTNTVAPKKQPLNLPIQYQQAAYIVDKEAVDEKGIEEESALKVGARVASKDGSLPLREVITNLAALKGMTVSWDADVKKDSLVDVNINPDDDFYQAINNTLRQVDYFYKVEGKTIIVKHKERRQFQIAMPFTKQKFTATVGGNILGASGAGESSSEKQVEGVLGLDSEDNEFDLWGNIDRNLKIIFDVIDVDFTLEKETHGGAKRKETASTRGNGYGMTGTGGILGTIGAVAGEADLKSKGNTTVETGKRSQIQSTRNARARSKYGYFYIDRPVGTITCVAPPAIIKQVEEYLTSLKRKLYKQVAIEAKIIEVQLDNESNIGINWNNVLKNFKLFSGALTFGADGQVYPYLKNKSSYRERIYTDHTGKRTYNRKDDESGLDWYHNSRTGVAFYDAINPGQFISKIALSAANFTAFVNALKEEGQTKILSNPKISVMNGQPAMITVGQNKTYVSEITVDIDPNFGTRTYTPSTSRLLSGVSMALTATILDDKEIIMNLIPITSELEGNYIPYEYVGSEGMKIGVPTINIREMSTTVRVGDGEMLVIGGLISDAESKDEKFMPILGDIPGIRYLFGYEQKKHKKRELIILLRPRII